MKFIIFLFPEALILRVFSVLLLSGLLSLGFTATNETEYYPEDRNSVSANQKNVSKPPNVLFISVDDMNDWVGYLNGYPGKVYTPNIDRLAEEGIAFTNAHVPAPVCNPSRTAILTGLYPSTTGIYGNYHVWVPNLPDVVTIPKHFKNNGYYVAGGGKIYHQPTGFNPPNQWHKFLKLIRDDPWNDHFSIEHCGVNCKLCQTVFKDYLEEYPSVNCPDDRPDWFPLSGLPEANTTLASNFDWGAFDKSDLEMGDGKMVEWAIDFLSKKHGAPFFLGTGIFRPHQPWYVPQKYFDLYPLDKIKTPAILENDLEDIPDIGRSIAHSHTKDLKLVKKSDKYKEAIQAYLASISFADALIGNLINALEKTPYTDNTIVVLWSDHGWHLGEKEAWKKSTLWEESTRVPFIIYDPRMNKEGAHSNRPVNVIDMYPTLIELCGLPEKPELDGISLVPLLQNPEAEWMRPALTTKSQGSHALRDGRWRYIRYSDGGEELYDHENDPNEWYNLADDSRYNDVKEKLAKWLPENEAPPVKDMNAYEFDLRTYSWTNR